MLFRELLGHENPRLRFPKADVIAWARPRLHVTVTMRKDRFKSIQVLPEKFVERSVSSNYCRHEARQIALTDLSDWSTGSVLPAAHKSVGGLRRNVLTWQACRWHIQRRMPS